MKIPIKFQPSCRAEATPPNAGDSSSESKRLNDSVAPPLLLLLMEVTLHYKRGAEMP